MLNNWYILGFMGTGKSVVAKLLAGRTGRQFVDMDAEIEKEAKTSISQIFATKGEPHFRAMERALLAKLSKRSGLVVACGGGIVISDENWHTMKRSGLTVCLTAPVEVLLKRLKGDTTRPLLAYSDKKDRMQKLLNQRAVFYGKSHFRLDITSLGPNETARIIHWLFSAF